MNTEIQGYLYLNPDDCWVLDDNGDGTSVYRNLLPIDEWVCYECQEPIGWQTWYTNTYEVTRWTGVYVEEGKDIMDTYTVKLCEDCEWGE